MPLIAKCTVILCTSEAKKKNLPFVIVIHYKMHIDFRDV